jgi:hypothetical protein
MKKYDNIIAIYPGSDICGVAFLKPSTRQLESASLSIQQLQDYLDFADNVRIETKESLTVLVCVCETFKKVKTIIDVCNRNEFEIVEYPPLAKIWKGPSGEITHDELYYFTGITGHTNQLSRNAALMAWSFAGFPIGIKSKIVL